MELPQAYTSDLLCRQPCHTYSIQEWNSLTRLADSLEDICGLSAIVKRNCFAPTILILDSKWWSWVELLPLSFCALGLFTLSLFVCEWICSWEQLFDMLRLLHLLLFLFDLLAPVLLKLDWVHELDSVPCLLLHCYTFVFTHRIGHALVLVDRMQSWCVSLCHLLTNLIVDNINHFIVDALFLLRYCLIWIEDELFRIDDLLDRLAMEWEVRRCQVQHVSLVWLQ